MEEIIFKNFIDERSNVVFLEYYQLNVTCSENTVTTVYKMYILYRVLCQKK